MDNKMQIYLRNKYYLRTLPFSKKYIRLNIFSSKTVQLDIFLQIVHFIAMGFLFSALIDISKQTYSLSFENAAIRSFAYFSFIQQGHKINMYYQVNDTQSNYNVNKISFKHFKKI